MLVASNNFSATHLYLAILLTDFFGVKIELFIFLFYCQKPVCMFSFYTSGSLLGNKKSLVDAMEKGINLREQILKLYRDYYHGGLMKLVVIGGGEVFFFLCLLSPQLFLWLLISAFKVLARYLQC